MRVADKRQIEEASAKLSNHLVRELGLYPLLMMDGKYARVFADPKHQSKILALIEDETRRAHVGEIFHHWQEMRRVWRPATMPDEDAIYLYATHRDALHDLIVNPEKLGGYIEIPNYVHMLMEHVENEDHPMGIWGTEGLEAANKIWKFVRKHMSGGGKGGMRDALVVMSLRTNPRLMAHVYFEPVKQCCSSCGGLGHKKTTCPARCVPAD